MHEWTPEAANAALGEVSERVERVIALLDSARRESHVVHDDEYRPPVTNGRRHLQPDEESARTALLGLEAEGIVLRDPDRGVVEFHAVSPSGEAYCLSWVVGEDEVAWWHWPGAGIEGRSPLTAPPA